MTSPRERCEEVHGALAPALQAQRGRPVRVATRAGEVTFHRVRMGQRDGVPYVEIWTSPYGKGDEPQYRIINPPTLVRDPAGPVEHQGRRYRHDPVAAIADVVASVPAERRKRRR